MQIIPVVDVLDGVVVRGVAGDRANYRPVQSRLTSSCDVLDVARAFQERFDFDHLYVADLDAIAGRPRPLGLYRRLSETGMRVLLDAGLRSADEALELVRAGVDVVAGLETLQGPSELAKLCETAGAERVTFSLDLRDGVPMLSSSCWPSREPLEIVESAVAAGIGSLIVLELARVGTGAGPGVGELCRQIRQRVPQLQLITGGGVRGIEDLHALSTIGVDGVLVASALHDGTLTPENLAGLSR